MGRLAWYFFSAPSVFPIHEDIEKANKSSVSDATQDSKCKVITIKNYPLSKLQQLRENNAFHSTPSYMRHQDLPWNERTREQKLTQQLCMKTH